MGVRDAHRSLHLDVVTTSDSRGLKKAAHDLDGIGDSARVTEKHVAGLDDEIAKLTAHLKDVRREAARTGDIDLLSERDFRADERRLQALIKLSKEMKHDLAEMAPKPMGLRETSVELDRVTRRIKELRIEIRSATRRGDERQGLFGQLGDLKAEKRELTKMVKFFEFAGVQAADATATGFAKSLPGSLRTKLIGAAVGIGVVLSPFLGAAISSLVTTAIGVAGIAGGIALAARDPRVKQAARDFGKTVVGDMKVVGLDFVGPTVVALGRLRSAWTSIAPDITRVMHSLSGAVEPLADGIAEFIKRMTPGFTHALDQGAKLAGIFGDTLGEFGQDLGDMFKAMADGKGNAEGLRATMDLLGGTLKGLGVTLGWLSDRFSDWNNLNAKTTGALEDIFYWVSTSTEDALPAFSRAVGGVGNKIAGWNNHAEEWQGNLQKVAGHLNGVAYQAQQAGIASARAAEDFEKFNQAIEDMQDANISAEEAMIRLEQAIDDTADAIRENGRGIDADNPKQRANREALLGVADAANQVHEAVLKQTGSMQLADQAAQRGRDQFIKLAIQMGLTRVQAQQLADQWIRIPSNKRLTITTSGFTSVFDNLARLKARIREIQTRIDIKANISGAFGGGAHTGLGNAPGFASGGYPPMDGSPFTVNEGGPEMMMMQGGRLKVLSSAQSRQVLSGSGRFVTPAPVRPLVISGNALIQQLIQEIAGEVRRRGGELAVLGLKG